MAISIRADIQDSATFGGTLTLNKPADTAEGDVLFMAFGNLTDLAVDTPPSGWSNLEDQYIAAGNTRCHLWYKEAGASEPSDYDWVFQATEEWNAIMFCVTDTDGFDTSDSGQTGAGTSHTTAAIVPASNGSLLMAIHICEASTSFTSADTWDEEWDSVGRGVTLALYSYTQGTAASIDHEGTSADSVTTADFVFCCSPVAAGGLSIPIAPISMYHYNNMRGRTF